MCVVQRYCYLNIDVCIEWKKVRTSERVELKWGRHRLPRYVTAQANTDQQLDHRHQASANGAHMHHK
jgi:hypothetical protein